MNQKTIAPLILSIIMTGCASPVQNLKQQNTLNVFQSSGSLPSTARKIYDMARYCEKTIFTWSINEFPSINKATIDSRIKDSDYYSMQIEVEELEAKKLKISIFSLHNTKITRSMASQVEKWANTDSKECPPTL